MPFSSSTKSTNPGQDDLHALRMMRLHSGWLLWNSTGLPAKHTITAFLALVIMLNNRLDKTKATTNPILKYENLS